jgi:hypothetical protein
MGVVASGIRLTANPDVAVPTQGTLLIGGAQTRIPVGIGGVV